MITSRSGSQGNASATPPQTIEAVRRRARHRLIGAAVLVLVGVLGFPLLFDTEPRPVAGDIPIEIPSRGTVDGSAALVAKARAADEPSPAPAVKAAATSAAAVPVQDSMDAREAVVEPSGGAGRHSNAAADTAAKASPKPSNPPESSDKTAAADAAKEKEAQRAAAAKASTDDKPAGLVRLVVQVGAFSDPVSARSTRWKVERAGMTTYTHVADTPSGKLIRVRVGPFGSQAEADKAAARVKALGLPARILAL